MEKMTKDKRLTLSQLSSIRDQLGEGIRNVRPQRWKTIFGRLIENVYFRLAMVSYIKSYYTEDIMETDLLMFDLYEKHKGHNS